MCASPQEAVMVSISHFRLELLTQMAEAATMGQLDILINSQDLCRTFRTGSSWSSSCCNAMEAEMNVGDTLIVERASPAGMTVRYVLPRNTH
jgi:hypothetical protein